MNRPGCPLGGPRCPESICDCFIETHPDEPTGLHPEMFVVGTVLPRLPASPTRHDERRDDVTIRAQTYYDVICDEPGCGRASIDLGGDYSAWSDAGSAEEDWENGDGQTAKTIDGIVQHFCEKHRKPTCANCDRADDLRPDLDHPGDLACPDCYPTTEGDPR